MEEGGGWREPQTVVCPSLFAFCEHLIKLSYIPSIHSSVHPFAMLI